MSSQSPYLKKLHGVALQGVVNDLVQEKEEGWKGRTSRDSYTTKHQCLELMGITITKDALYKRVERQSKKQPNARTRPIEKLTTNPNDPEVSSMSSPSTGSDTNSLSTAGRPKGSTNEKKREEIKNYKECINAVSQAYHSELTHCKDQKKKVKGGFLAQIIEKEKGKFDVSCNIPEETIRSQIKQKRLVPTHRGTSAPLYNAELALVEICIQMGKIRQPLTCEEAIAIMNDMISETEMSDSLTQFQKVRTPNSGTIGVVGRNWWRGFKKRHASKIVSKKGEKFASNRADWTKLSNIKHMYEYIYKEMINAHIASPCVNPVYTDQRGIEVEESERFGLIQEIKIDHPDYILFADESGCQTMGMWAIENRLSNMVL